MLLINHLDNAGYKIMVAESGRTALEQVRRTLPDIILLDVVMPDLDGYETCHMLKSTPYTAAIPVLFLTNLNDPVDRVRGFQVGGVDYINKPIEPNEVLARVRTHITLYKLQQQLAENNAQLAKQNVKLETTLRHQNEKIERKNADLRTETVLRRRYEVDQQAFYQRIHHQDMRLAELVANVLERQSDTAGELLTVMYAPLHTKLVQMSQSLNEMMKQPESDESSLENLLANVKEMQEHLMQFLSDDNLAEYKQISEQFATLSEREHEVFHLLVTGKSIGEISAELNVSEATIRTYRTRIMNKLDAFHLPALVRIALLQGIHIII